MKALTGAGRFYLKPFLAVTAINLLFYFFAGSYFESYDCIFSALMQGTFTVPCLGNWYENPHFLLMGLYQYIGPHFPHVQVYGVALFAYNWLGLTLMGLFLYRVWVVNVKSRNMILYVVLYGILFSDNMINLSSTRVALILAVSGYMYVESCRQEGKALSPIQWALIAGLFFWGSLIRIEVVLLTSVCYIIALVIFNRFYKLSVLSFFLSLSLYAAYNYATANLFTTAQQVMIYREKDIVDRRNIDFSKVTPVQMLDVEAITQYAVADKVHFTFEFYDKVSRTKKGGKLKDFLDGFTYESFKNALLQSYVAFFESRYYLFLFLLSGVFCLVTVWNDRLRYGIYFVFFALFPVSACLNSMLPESFLIPYYAFWGCFNIVYVVRYRKDQGQLTGFALVILLLVMANVVQTVGAYRVKDETYWKTARQIRAINKSERFKDPVVISQVDLVKFFPADPLALLPRQNAVFLNFWLISAWQFYIRTWAHVYPCDPFSLEEKTDYVVANGNLFLVDETNFQFLQKYFALKYHKELRKQEVAEFDAELKVCKLYYESAR